MILVLFLWGCFSESSKNSNIDIRTTFLRGAILVSGDVNSQEIPQDWKKVSEGKWLKEYEWKHNEDIEVLKDTYRRAPMRANCVSIAHTELGDVSRMISLQAGVPNTFMAWSHDESKLLVGTHLGDVMILDGWSGEVLERKHLAESLIKYVAWSKDDQSIYVAEQSVEGNVYAFDQKLQQKWKFTLSDIVESSAPPATEDIYGVYSLPAAFGLVVLSDDSLIVPATHAWNKNGVFTNRSQLLHLSKSGEILKRWPKKVANATLKFPVVDEFNNRMILSVEKTSSESESQDVEQIQTGGIQVLSLSEFSTESFISLDPLQPHFSTSMIWQALDLSSSEQKILAGYSDGRFRITDSKGKQSVLLETSTPILAGDVPIYAIIGWGKFYKDIAFFNTSPTYIPYTASSPNLKPPADHPSAGGLFAINMEGDKLWNWHGDYNIQGISIQKERGELVIGAGDRNKDNRKDLYGAIIFDTNGVKDDPMIATCMTPNPVFFYHSMTSDGRLAIAEHPYREEDGTVVGEYAIRILR